MIQLDLTFCSVNLYLTNENVAGKILPTDSVAGCKG